MLINHSLQQNQITSKGASVLCDTLKTCHSVVTTLNISHNQINDDCIKSFAELIQDNESLAKLNLRSNLITDKGIELLCDCLVGYSVITDLYLIGNQGITNASLPYLIDIIKKTHIIDLDALSSEAKEEEIRIALKLPIEQRQIPVASKSKSASKSTFQ